MYECEDCGAVIGERDLKRVKYFLDDRDSPTVAIDIVCPCGGDVFEVKKCPECGEYVDKLSLLFGMCEECFKNKEEE